MYMNVSNTARRQVSEDILLVLRKCLVFFILKETVIRRLSDSFPHKLAPWVPIRKSLLP